VAIAYVVVSWVILQFVDVVDDILSLPEWFGKAVLVLVAIGFPFALLFSWAYEVTPEGVKKTHEVDKSKSITHGTGQKINRLIAGALVLAVGFIIYDKMVVEETAVVDEARAAATSIAVLPFVNISPDPEQEFFSDGMTEEILNVLAKNHGLLVVARTSAFSYKGQAKDVRIIGQELGVDNILEGSVRRAGDDLRITAQLIRVEDGFHLWSETYDRKLENVFALQEEIAFAISDALQVPLGLEAGQLVENRTTDMAAYDMYLQARQLLRKRGINIETAANLLEQVIEREPDFAPAWAALSLALALVDNYLTTFNGEPLDVPQLVLRSAETARTAVRLDPNLSVSHYALANTYRWRRNWTLAEDEYLLAMEIDPDDVEIIEDYSEFLSNVGRLEDTLPFAKKGYELEPLMPLAIMNYAVALYYLGQVEEAEQFSRRALELDPNFSWANTVLLEIYVERGRFADAFEIFDNCEACRTFSNYSESIKYLQKLSAGETNIPMDENFHEVFSVALYYAVGGEEGVITNMENYIYSRILTYDTFAYWNAPYMANVRKTERYKTMVKFTGLADYWRLRKWPDFCRPVGDDDFECA